MPGGAEWIIIAAIGLLISGKRLPEVGRSLGKGIVEFKKGLKGVDEEVKQVDQKIDQQTQPQLTTNAATPQPAQLPHKFDPYTGKPMENTAS
jgi:sec-independent protein translocase protein TatA